MKKLSEKRNEELKREYLELLDKGDGCSDIESIVEINKMLARIEAEVMLEALDEALLDILDDNVYLSIWNEAKEKLPEFFKEVM